MWFLKRDFINSHGWDGYGNKIVILSLAECSVSWIPLENSVIGARAVEPDLFSADRTFLNEENKVVTNIVKFKF